MLSFRRRILKLTTVLKSVLLKNWVGHVARKCFNHKSDKYVHFMAPVQEISSRVARTSHNLV